MKNKFNIIILTILLILGFVLNFLPHLDYDYPLHVDEWVHFTYSKHISDDSPLYFSDSGESLETGFHFLLAVLNLIGIPYLILFKFFAGFLNVLISLGVFVLVRRIWTERAALFSVLFITVLKSSVLLLGPMFVVPMAIGLFFIPIGLFLGLYCRRLLFLIIASLLIIHPPSAIALLILINVYLIIERKDVKNLLFQQGLGLLISLPLYLPILLRYQESTLDYLSFGAEPGFIFIPRFLGVLFTVLIVVGLFFLGNKRQYTFIVYPLVLLSLAILFYRYELNILIPYRRALMYLFEALAIFFGVGCSWIVSRFKVHRTAVLVVFILILLGISVPGKIDSTGKVYHLIDDNEYDDFLWIKDNTNGKVLLDPWKALAFTPIAERGVYSRIPQGYNETYMNRNKEIYEFFKDKCTNNTLLNENRIDVVYGDCEDKYRKLKDKVYVNY